MNEWDEPKNAEGYCKNCGQPLGISGICSICAVNKLGLIWNVHKCAICGKEMAHHRLHGYICTPYCEEKKRRLYEI
jgi:hypothetical protein